MPLHGTFELTSRCNLRCRMCYVRQPAADRAQLERELPAGAWLELARAAVDQGTVFLLLTGGEILLRPDFFELYEPLTRLGVVLTLFSNGTLITEEVADRLAAAPPSHIAVTLYGASPETYAAVTGRGESFDRACAGVQRLVDRRVPLCLKATLTRQNAADLAALRRLAGDWGVPFRAGWLLSRRRDGGSSEVEDCRLSTDECLAIEALDSAATAEWEALSRDQAASGVAGEENFYCLAGQSAFAVDPAGAMNICLDLRQPGARPLEAGFAAAWEAVRRRAAAAPPLAAPCRACDARVYCARCPAWSWIETGTLDAPVEYLCGIARARKARHGAGV